MVRYFLLFCFSILSITSKAQIALLDDINQLDQERDKQLLFDNYKNTSFLLRSTSEFLKLQPKKQVKIWKKINWDGIETIYTIQSNSTVPSGFNDGSLFPSIGSQNRLSIRSRFTIDNFELNIQPEFVSARNINPPVFLGHKQDGNYWARYYLHIQNNIDYYTQYGKNQYEEINKNKRPRIYLPTVTNDLERLSSLLEFEQKVDVVELADSTFILKV